MLSLVSAVERFEYYIRVFKGAVRQAIQVLKPQKCNKHMTCNYAIAQMLRLAIA